MSKPAEILTFEFLDEIKLAANVQNFLSANEKSLLAGMTIHDTVYQNFTTGQNYGIRIGEVPSTFAPNFDGNFKEFDAEVPLAVFARVVGSEKSNRAASLEKVFAVSILVCKLFNAYQDLKGRGCDSLLLRWIRGFDEMDGEAYAVANTSLIINPSGAYDFRSYLERR